jgi:general stress protein 26
MNSINQQQQEDNFQNLNGQEALEKIRQLTGKASTCFFCTNIKTGTPFSVRPMAVQKVDEDGYFWFLSASDSFKDNELSTDPHAQLFISGV